MTITRAGKAEVDEKKECPYCRAGELQFLKKELAIANERDLIHTQVEIYECSTCGQFITVREADQ